MIVEISQDNLAKICDQIGEALALPASKDNPDDLMGKLNELTNLLGSSAHSIAIAEELYNERIVQLIEAGKYSDLGANEKKMLYEGKARVEQRWVTISIELNRSLMKAIESLRSMLSYLKAEMNNLPTN